VDRLGDDLAVLDQVGVGAIACLLSGDTLPRDLSVAGWCRPTTTTRLPLASDSATCSAWSRHTMTVKNDASPLLRLDTASGRRPSHPLSCNGLGVVGEFAGERTVVP
jgi:hypothetical protein